MYLYANGSAENWYPEGQQPLDYALKVFADQAAVSALSPVHDDTITLYAQWSQISIAYTIEYDANGGSGTMANTNASYWVPVGLPANTFTRTNYQFGGWTAERASDNKYLYENGSAEDWYLQNQQPSGYALKVFADQETVSALSPVDDDTITMYAQWNASYFTVVYNANGGTGIMANTTVQYGVSTNLLVNLFKRTDYNFTGWTAKRTSDNKYMYINY